jgi:hypothetical protein
MSNHYHAVVHESEERICERTEIFNELLTKTTQVVRGWQRSVFDGAGPTYVELLTVKAVVDRTAHALVNPTQVLAAWREIPTATPRTHHVARSAST